MNNKVKSAEALHNVRNISNLKEMISESVKLFKQNVAFKYRENEEIVDITYEKLGDDINSLGTSLLELGLKGKKIAIIGGNSYKWCTGYLAVVCGTGIIVPIDKALPPGEIENLLIKSEAEAILFDGKYIDTMKQIKASNKSLLKHLICFDNDLKDNEVTSFEALIEFGKQLIEKGDMSFINAKIDNKTMSILLFTSGTTSASKVVMLSHYNICSNMMGIASVIKYYENDVLLSFLPLHHTLECTVTFLTGLYSGSCIGVCSGIKYIMQDLVEYKASVLVSVPLIIENIYKKIKQQIEASSNKITNEQILNMLGGKLRFALVGAAALGKDVILGMKDLGIRICQGYGLTETSPVLTAENDKYANPGSIGYALPGIEIEIDNPDDTGLGEIKCKGPNIMLGYYNDEAATNEVLKNGWFYTGDLGYVDKDGYLFIAGRKKNVIVLKNGKKIFPEEIEILINNNPLVAESFVYSASTKEKDCEIRAEIVYNKEAVESTYGNITEDQIQEIMDKYIREVNHSLPLYKYIRKVFVTVTPLIKTTTNKIKRNEELKKMNVA